MTEIEHVIVLMLENRSFDHMLGYLDHPDAAYERLQDGNHPNRFSTSKPPVGVSAVVDHDVKSPNHDHRGVMQQLFGQGDFHSSWRPTPPTVGQDWPTASNEGFVRSYGHKHGEATASKVMKCRAPEGNPVLAMLAKEYAVCTRWFSSVPGATWPNRDYVIAGTSRGEVDIDKLDGLHPIANTVFRAVKRAKRRWKVYHKDTPHSIVYEPLKRYFSRRFRSHSALLKHIRRYPKKRSLPNFAWVEPDYGLMGKGNSQHPGQAGSQEEFRAGEVLIADIYNALRDAHEAAEDKSESVFAKTLLVITYDEHGGFFDHVPPPATTPPDGESYRSGDYEFRFDLLGSRVPAVLVNPWLQQGSIVDTVFDHSSILATLRSLFGVASMADRDAVARPLWSPQDPAWAQRFLRDRVRESVPAAEPLPIKDGHRALAPLELRTDPKHPGLRVAPLARNDLQELHIQLEERLMESLDDGIRGFTRSSALAREMSVMDLVKGASPRTVDVIAPSGETNLFCPEDPEVVEPVFDEYWEQGVIEMVDDEDWSLKIEPETGGVVLSSPEGVATHANCTKGEAQVYFERFLRNAMTSLRD